MVLSKKAKTVYATIGVLVLAVCCVLLWLFVFPPYISDYAPICADGFAPSTVSLHGGRWVGKPTLVLQGSNGIGTLDCSCTIVKRVVECSIPKALQDTSWKEGRSPTVGESVQAVLCMMGWRLEVGPFSFYQFPQDMKVVSGFFLSIGGGQNVTLVSNDIPFPLCSGKSFLLGRIQGVEVAAEFHKQSIYMKSPVLPTVGAITIEISGNSGTQWFNCGETWGYDMLKQIPICSAASGQTATMIGLEFPFPAQCATKADGYAHWKVQDAISTNKTVVECALPTVDQGTVELSMVFVHESLVYYAPVNPFHMFAPATIQSIWPLGGIVHSLGHVYVDLAAQSPWAAPPTCSDNKLYCKFEDHAHRWPPLIVQGEKVNDTNVKCEAPPMDHPGLSQLSVSENKGNGGWTAAHDFMFVAPKFSKSSLCVAPARGENTRPCVITGTNLTDLGSVQCRYFYVSTNWDASATLDGDTLTCHVPPMPAHMDPRIVFILISLNGQQWVLTPSEAIYFDASQPNVDGPIPPGKPVNAAGVGVQVTGAHLRVVDDAVGPLLCWFGDHQVQAQDVSDGGCVCEAPVGLPPGRYDLSVGVPKAQSVPAPWVMYDQIEILSLYPSKELEHQNTTVVIQFEPAFEWWPLPEWTISIRVLFNQTASVPGFFTSSRTVQCEAPDLAQGRVGEVTVQVALDGISYSKINSNARFLYRFCAEGHHVPEDKTVCEPCPDGTSGQDGMWCVPCSVGTVQPFSGQDHCVVCPIPLLCPGRNHCVDEYVWPLCTQCANGRIGGQCASCPMSIMGLVLGPCLLLLALCGVGWFALRPLRSSWMAALYIMIDALQITAFVGGFKRTMWPGEWLDFTMMLHLVPFVNLGGLSWEGCHDTIEGWAFKVIVTLFFPMGILLVWMTVRTKTFTSVLRYAPFLGEWPSLRSVSGTHALSDLSAFSISDDGVASVDRAMHSFMRGVFASRVLPFITAIVEFSLAPIVYAIVVGFSCTPLEGTMVLRAHPKVECWSTEHLLVMGLVMGLLLIFFLGGLWMMISHAVHALNTKAHKYVALNVEQVVETSSERAKNALLFVVRSIAPWCWVGTNCDIDRDSRIVMAVRRILLVLLVALLPSVWWLLGVGCFVVIGCASVQWSRRFRKSMMIANLWLVILLIITALNEPPSAVLFILLGGVLLSFVWSRLHVAQGDVEDMGECFDAHACLANLFRELESEERLLRAHGLHGAAETKTAIGCLKEMMDAERHRMEGLLIRLQAADRMSLHAVQSMSYGAMDSDGEVSDHEQENLESRLVHRWGLLQQALDKVEVEFVSSVCRAYALQNRNKVTKAAWERTSSLWARRKLLVDKEMAWIDEEMVRVKAQLFGQQALEKHKEAVQGFALVTLPSKGREWRSVVRLASLAQGIANPCRRALVCLDALAHAQKEQGEYDVVLLKETGVALASVGALVAWRWNGAIAREQHWNSFPLDKGMHALRQLVAVPWADEVEMEGLLIAYGHSIVEQSKKTESWSALIDFCSKGERPEHVLGRFVKARQDFELLLAALPSEEYRGIVTTDERIVQETFEAVSVWLEGDRRSVGSLNMRATTYQDRVRTASRWLEIAKLLIRLSKALEERDEVGQRYAYDGLSRLGTVANGPSGTWSYIPSILRDAVLFVRAPLGRAIEFEDPSLPEPSGPCAGSDVLPCVGDTLFPLSMLQRASTYAIQQLEDTIGLAHRAEQALRNGAIQLSIQDQWTNRPFLAPLGDTPPACVAWLWKPEWNRSMFDDVLVLDDGRVVGRHHEDDSLCILEQLSSFTDWLVMWKCLESMLDIGCVMQPLFVFGTVEDPWIGWDYWEPRVWGDEEKAVFQIAGCVAFAMEQLHALGYTHGSLSFGRVYVNQDRWARVDCGKVWESKQCTPKEDVDALVGMMKAALRQCKQDTVWDTSIASAHDLVDLLIREPLSVENKLEECVRMLREERRLFCEQRIWVPDSSPPSFPLALDDVLDPASVFWYQRRYGKRGSWLYPLVKESAWWRVRNFELEWVYMSRWKEDGEVNVGWEMKPFAEQLEEPLRPGESLEACVIAVDEVLGIARNGLSGERGWCSYVSVTDWVCVARKCGTKTLPLWFVPPKK